MPYDREKDPLSNVFSGATSGCRKVAEVTPDDDEDFDIYVKVLMIEGDGDVCFIPAGNADDETVTLTRVAGDVIDYIQIRRVLATGTTASPLFVGW